MMLINTLALKTTLSEHLFTFKSFITHKESQSFLDLDVGEYNDPPVDDVL